MKLNRCPAIAPLSVLDEASIDRLKLDMDAINTNLAVLDERKDELAAKLKKVTAKLDSNRDERNKRQTRIPYEEERLYDKFIERSDAALFDKARNEANQQDLSVSFSDKRLSTLYQRHRARNYPKSLNQEQTAEWQDYVKNKLFNPNDSEYLRFGQSLKQLRSEITDKQSLKLLDDLDFYAKTIANDYGIDLPDADV
jgi:exodeoxyribonuclease-1